MKYMGVMQICFFFLSFLLLIIFMIYCDWIVRFAGHADTFDLQVPLSRLTKVWPKYQRVLTSLHQFTLKLHMALNQSCHVLVQMTRPKGAVPRSLAPLLSMQPAIIFFTPADSNCTLLAQRQLKKSRTSACHISNWVIVIFK